MKVRFPLLSLALGLVASASTHAQVLWTGLIDGSTNNALNWVGTPAGADLLFNASIRPNVIVDASLSVRSLTFNLLYPSYSFSTANGSILSIGSGGIVVAAQGSNTVDFATSLPLTLTASQTWAVDGSLTVAGNISNPPANTVVLTKTGAGSLILNGVNTFNGGLVIQAGTVTVGSSTISAAGVITSGPTGTGNLTIGANTTFGANRAALTLGNAVSLGNGVTLLSGSSVSTETGLNLSGPVTTATDDMLIRLSGSRPVVFSGTLDGPADSTLRFQGANAGGADGAQFTGTTSANIINLIADNASLYFVSTTSLPATVSLGAVNNGYTGVMATTSGSALPASALLSAIATPASFAGTFGFDTQSGSAHVYTENLNFSAFTQPTFILGSTTSAVLTGTLTPPISGGTATYRFGSGGGSLSVRSNLTNAVDPITTLAVPTAVVLTTNRTNDTGRGQVALTGANTYTGGTTLQNGALIVGNGTTRSGGLIVSGPIGTGALNVGTSTQPLILASNAASGATLYNNIVLGGPLQLGLVDTMTDPATTSFDSNLLILSGNLSGVGRIDIFGQAIFDGTNTYSGGTYAHSGGVIFATAASLPATGTLRSDANAYIGIASVPTGSLQTGYINHFDPVNTHGTIGFDTLDTTTTVFANPISLTAFTSPTVRLGSATSARITGAITPAGTTYRFGGGGGTLEVDGDLNRGTELELSSPAGGALMMRVSGKINYSGDTTVTNSGLVLADNGIANSSAFVMDATSYIGTEDPSYDTSFATYLNHFAVGLDRGIIGFDTDPALTTRTINTTLSLARFTAVAPNFYIGTSSSVIFGASSAINLPTNATAYRFAGYRGGRLQLDTVLSGSKGVIIGDPASSMTQASPAGVVSSVVLNAANTFTNGTTLYAGDLYLGTSSIGTSPITSGPLGTGALTVASNLFSGRPALRVLSAPITLANPIVLNSSLDVGSDLTLTGAISGSGSLRKIDVGTLTLSGNNSWTGGLFITQGGATLTDNRSAGTGTLSLGSSFASTATFLSSAPAIGTLSGQNSGDQLVLANNSALSITQAGTSQFLGVISGTGAQLNVQALTPGSTAQLTLGGANVYTGGTTIGSGVVMIASNNNALGSAGTVTLNQSTLAVSSGITASFNGSTHPLVINGGTLRGTGTLSFDTPLNVGTGTGGAVVLAPGLQGPGRLNFNFTSGATLILNSGGSYQWRLTDTQNATTGWDTIAVNGGVNLAATALAPFNFTIATVGSDGSAGEASHFDVYSSYSWTLISATSFTGFDLAKINLDTTGFVNATLDGTFSLALDGTGTSLMLNYTAAAIPEPSTWALMISGAAALAISSLRRRRR